jgi:hypothetical protein
VIECTSTYKELKRYLFPAFSFLEITWAASELLGLSQAIGEKYEEVLIINRM